MHDHDTHRMHSNSLAAYRDTAEMRPRLARSFAIVEVLRQRGPMTDRQVASALNYPHKSAVQPRISELVEIGQLVERGSVKDEITGKPVRVCAVRPPEQQMFNL